MVASSKTQSLRIDLLIVRMCELICKSDSKIPLSLLTATTEVWDRSLSKGFVERLDRDDATLSLREMLEVEVGDLPR